MTEPDPASPTAFVSWAHSHGSWDQATADAWKAQVGSFTTALVGFGVRATVDLQFEHVAGVDWTRFGPAQIEQNEWTIVALSPAWGERWDGNNSPHEGAGAVGEADALKGVFAKDQAAFREKVVLVVLPMMHGENDLIPENLYGVQHRYVTDFALSGMTPLLALLTDQHEYAAPPLGPVPTLFGAPPKPRTPATPSDVSLRVPVGSISASSSLDLGVRRAAVDATDGESTFIPRVRAGEELTAAIDDALARRGPAQVLVVGRSAAGKTRLLYETLARHDRPLTVVAPTSIADLSGALDLAVSHAEAAHEADADARPGVVIWLEDVEEFVGGDQGLTPAAVRRISATPGVIVVGTAGGKGSAVTSQAPEKLAAPLTDLIESGSTVQLDHLLSSSELTAARATGAYDAATIDAFEQRGPGAHFVAGPTLHLRFNELATAAPEARAVLDAALAWRHAGIADPAPEDALFALWRCSPAVTACTDEAFAAALAIARTPTNYGQVFPLERTVRDDHDLWGIHDYLAGAVTRALTDCEWEAILKHAPAQDLSIIGVTAARAGHPQRAECALRRGVEHGDVDATFNLGVLFGERADAESDPEKQAALRNEEEAAYRRADRGGSPNAASNLGVLLAERAAAEPDPAKRAALLVDAEAAYRRGDQRGHGNATYNLGTFLGRMADDERDPARRSALRAEEEATYRRADERGHAAAASNLGVMLGQQADAASDPDEQAALHAEEESAFRRADERGDAYAACNLGVLLARKANAASDPGQQAALRTEEEAAHRRAERRGSTNAAFNLGVFFGERADAETDPEQQAVLRTEEEAAYRRASRGGDPHAAYVFGIVLQRRVDAEPNPERRAALRAEQEAAFRQADEGGVPDAAFSLGVLLGLEADVESDPDKQAALRDEEEAAYRRACQRGSIDALCNLGVLLGRRAEAEPDPDKQAALRDEEETAYRRASERGDPDATFNLGLLLGRRAEAEPDPDKQALLRSESDAAFRRAAQHDDDDEE